MRISIIGLGTVGQGVVALLERHRDLYAQRCGCQLQIVAAMVRDASRRREFTPGAGALVTSDREAFFATPSDLVVEVAGGIEPARTHQLEALRSGRDVVTANKALIAAHGEELFAAAEGARRRLFFEAAVAGGVPAVAFVQRALAANRLHALLGIYNGTCNFIISAMERGGSYAEALAEAQRRGFAEADPTLDVSGRDSVQKLAIMATLAFGGAVHPDAIECEGVEKLTPKDISNAAARGMRIRLVACAAARPDGSVMLWNGPTLVDASSALGSCTDANMAIMAYGDAVSWASSAGDGAGRFPTASAVVGDILEIARLRELRPQTGRLNDWPTGAQPLRTANWDGPAQTGAGGARMREIRIEASPAR